MAKSFKNQDPRDIIQRVLILERLKTLPPKMILQLPKEYHLFVKGNESAIVTAKGQKVSDLEIDWEYALFTATNKRLLDLFSFFQQKPKENAETKQ